MITSIYDSATSYTQENSPYQTPATNKPVGQLQIASQAAEQGILLQQVDLASVQNVGDYSQIELEIQTAPGAAPGANQTVTIWSAFATSGSKQPVELVTNAASFVCAVPNVPGRTSVFMPPLAYMGGRYLYVWFDHTAFGAAVPVNLHLRVNCQRA